MDTASSAAAMERQRKRMTMRRISVGWIALLVCTLGASSAYGTETPSRACTATAPDIACTAQGAVRGASEGDLLVFKALPYSQPPVGNLRWRPPLPPVPWEGVRDGSRFGAVCPQIATRQVVGDEDCLTLNIWRPRELPAHPLPVMVFLTGGGNHGLSGQGTESFGNVRYDGGALVPEGVVFVSFNIRLGVLGFLAHAALDAERPERISGNYGNLDQIALLQWLNRNIASFGGDPKRIMLFGTSAGGGNICALISSPLARGLFHAAAMESSVPTGCEIPTLAQVEGRTGQRVVEAVGCDSAANVAACLRSKRTSEIVSAVPAGTNVFPRIYGPNMDGHVFPDQPLRIVARRAHTAMPIVIGNTTDETLGWVRSGTPITDAQTYSAEIEKVFGAGARERILAAYPLSSYSTPASAFIQLTTDAQFTCTSRRVARVFSGAQKEPVYRYLFSHVMANDAQLTAAGANHTIEHAFLFPLSGSYKPTAADLTVQRFIVGYWTRLALTGTPNSGRDPQWPAAAGDAYLELNAAPAANRGPDRAKCDLWDSLPVQWPHL
jgi:para-nitrobenzyl esterase